MLLPHSCRHLTSMRRRGNASPTRWRTMRKFVVLSFAFMVSALLLISCQREQGVQAGYEQGKTDTYQPRPAPKGEVEQNQEVSGELQRVNMAAKTVSIRVDNGMEQTFKFDDNTEVVGLQGQQGSVPSKQAKVNNA